MAYRYLPKSLPDRLRAAGLNVVVLDGWHSRGRPTSTGGFAPVGMLNHHTGARDEIGDFANDRAYAEWMAKVGRSDLPAPLVQLSLSLEATVYVLAAGRCNHAGTAKSAGSVAGGDGNNLYVGMEWMLSGTQNIPAKMYQAGATVNAVMLELLGSSVRAVHCHYETSTTGKWDIGDPNGIPFGGHKVLDVPKFQRVVQAHLDAGTGRPSRRQQRLRRTQARLEVARSAVALDREALAAARAELAESKAERDRLAGRVKTLRQ